MRRAVGGLIVLLVILVIGVAWAAWQRASANDLSIDFGNHYPPLAEGIRGATKVTLFEGLPHQSFERDLLARELATRSTIQLHGSPFYESPLPLSAEDGKLLTDLFCGGRSLKPNLAYVMMGNRTRNLNGSVIVAEKGCGGFHPDYCVQWDVGGEVYRLLVCFGCGEVKCFGPRLNLHCDLDSPEWRRILGNYRQQRPKTGSQGG